MTRMKAVIFDFDGLMLDTEWPAFEAWSEIYKEHGQTLELSEWVACVGASYASFDPVTRLSELTGKTFQREVLISDKERRKLDECNRLGAMPGVAELIEEAKALGVKLAVASSSPLYWVEGHLTRLQLRDHIELIRTREHVERIKPFPDLYLAAAKGLNVDPEHCIVFEDSLNGVKAAKAAGMICYAIPNRVTSLLDFTEADGRYDSLALVSLKNLHLRPS